MMEHLRVVIVTATDDSHAANWPILAKRIKPQMNKRRCRLEWHVLQSLTDTPAKSNPAAETLLDAGARILQAYSDPNPYAKFNWWISTMCQRAGNRYVHLMSDGDLPSRQFYDGMATHYELTSVFPWPHAFVFTMLRGEYVEPGQPADSISPLTPNKNAIFLGKVSLSQTAIVEPMLSRYRFDSWTDTGMGQMMRSIYKRTGAIAYSPRLAVFYKAMETARWGKLPTDPLPFAPDDVAADEKRDLPLAEAAADEKGQVVDPTQTEVLL